MTAPRVRRTSAEREALRPHIAEWFGHRVYPAVADHAQARQDQRAERCPFLSDLSWVKRVRALRAAV